MRVYYDNDADINLIKKKKILVVGYGSQGHAHINNLRDSGCAEVRVGLRSGGPSAKKAQAAGFTVVEPADGAKWADLVMLLIPDEHQADLYTNDLRDNMKQGAALAFAHGLNIHFQLIEPRSDMDVFMIAPKGPGHLVRSEYIKGAGVPTLVAVYQDSSGNALDLALSYACANGGGRAGVIETTFREECETDLFGEQAVLCGGISYLIQAGFEILVENGYAPEMAYFECLHETKLIVDLLYEGGLKNMRYSISNTAEYGDYVTGPRLINAAVKAEMQKVLDDIKSGDFVRDFVLDNKAGNPKLKTIRKNQSEHQIEVVGEKLRTMMPWLQKDKLVNQDKN